LLRILVAVAFIRLKNSTGQFAAFESAKRAAPPTSVFPRQRPSFVWLDLKLTLGFSIEELDVANRFEGEQR
jgi:hypothetical protein